jgi:hypothetical protein|tara:strand:- start:4240 stop:5142 length:903 start_codon:yes stop_codon:yes gene_type:complete
MSNEKSALEAMLNQYEVNNKPKFEKSETAKVYDLKNYFTTYDLKDNEQSLTKEIRILPNPKGGSPLIDFKGHTAMVDGVKKTFACLQHEKGTACPFCEAHEALLAEGDENSKTLAKKYSIKKMYIAKVIDRNNEEDGVKFWRFNHDYRKEGVFDKIHGVVAGLKKFRDITSPTEGRDLSISINRNQTGVPVVSSITPQDSDILSENKEYSENWLADTRTWEDVYALRNYDYLKIVVMGGVPMWDKEEKCFVDKNKAEEVNEDASLDSELSMNVKTNVTAAETVTKTQSPAPEEEEDDLPF